jgi:hypothetical protein
MCRKIALKLGCKFFFEESVVESGCSAFLEMNCNDQKLSKFCRFQGMEFAIWASILRPCSLSTLTLGGFLGLEAFTFLGFGGSSLIGVSSMFITKSLSFVFSISLNLSLSLFLALVIGLWA